MTDAAQLARPAGADPAGTDAPVITQHEPDGRRTALTAAQLGGWAARTAGLLHDCGLGAGSRAAVLLPPHWRTAAALLGAWSLGVTVSFQLSATAGLPAVGPDAGVPFDVVFAARERLGSWLEDVPDAPHRFVFGEGGAAHRDPRDVIGYRDFEAAVAPYPADVPAPALVRTGSAASGDGTTYGQWGSIARELAERQELRAGDRVLIDATEHEHPVKWLLAPLSVGASIILCPGPARLDELAAAEGATRIFGRS
ncbi:TIGR03089 family protein [Dactylosporangium sp. NPDC050688]|uniref:TIGR03089 family protein n=1 Tax=Dactylosporangium sp. NPDC050688 TaxID=3157217 RepID=UPI0033E6FF50